MCPETMSNLLLSHLGRNSLNGSCGSSSGFMPMGRRLKARKHPNPSHATTGLVSAVRRLPARANPPRPRSCERGYDDKVTTPRRQRHMECCSHATALPLGQPCYPRPCRLTDARVLAFIREHGSLNGKAQARLPVGRQGLRTPYSNAGYEAPAS